jgi:hypothetical protein
VQPVFSWPTPLVTIPIIVRTTTPTIADWGNQVGGQAWLSNGFFFVTGSTNGTMGSLDPDCIASASLLQ